MREESFPNFIRIRDLATRVAILRKKAEQEKVMLPEDVALYIARNVRSNASALEGALTRLIAHSSLTGTDITLNYTRRVLKSFFDLHAHQATVGPFQMLHERSGTAEANIRRQPDHSLVFCALKARDGRRLSRVRKELEVNMREHEREQLARFDAYARELERRVKTRQRG